MDFTVTFLPSIQEWETRWVPHGPALLPLFLPGKNCPGKEIQFLDFVSIRLQGCRYTELAPADLELQGSLLCQNQWDSAYEQGLLAILAQSIYGILRRKTLWCDRSCLLSPCPLCSPGHRLLCVERQILWEGLNAALPQPCRCAPLLTWHGITVVSFSRRWLDPALLQWGHQIIRLLKVMLQFE